VVLVTGHPAHFESVKRSGHRFLYKPFDIGSLVQLVDESLREARAKCKTKEKRPA
jgi:FixJ family two-component response regulator